MSQVAFFYPSGFSVLLLAAGLLLWKKPRAARFLCFAALLILAAFSSSPVSHALLRSLENQYPDTGISAIPPAQAIVVLGGAIHSPSSQHESSGLIDSSDRLMLALRLYRAGKAPLLLCSGGGPGGAEADVMSRLLQEWGVPPEAILLENQSLNTRENALFSYTILKARGIRHILLVTSATHMPRAAAVFRKVGFTVSPAPADFRTGWGDGSTSLLDPLANFFAGDNLESSEKAWREWAGLLIYRLRGWT